MKYLPIKSKFIYVLLLILSLVNIDNFNKDINMYVTIAEYITVFTIFLPKSKIKNLILFVNLIILLPFFIFCIAFSGGDIFIISKRFIESFFIFM